MSKRLKLGAACASMITVALCASPSFAQQPTPTQGDVPADTDSADQADQTPPTVSADGPDGCEFDSQCKLGRVCIEHTCSQPPPPTTQVARKEPVQQSTDDYSVSTSDGSWHPGRDRPQRRFDYQEGEKLPDGFHLEETPSYGLVAAGAATFAGLWLTSLTAAVVLDREPTQQDDPNFDDMYWPLFIPVAGPFVAIDTSDASGTGAAILAMDGVLQLAGVGMFIAGFASPTVEIVEDRDLTIMPTASNEGGGLELSTEF